MKNVFPHKARLITGITAALLTAVSYHTDAQEINYSRIVSKPAPLFSQDTISLCILGDVMMHTKQIETAHRGDSTYDFSTYFSLLKDKIREADVAIGNMEFTLAGEPYTGYPAFSAPDCFADYLADCGFDIFLAANNHILDKGSKGMKRTLDIYSTMESKGRIRYAGMADNEEDAHSRQPLYILRNGVRIAILNFTYGTNVGASAHWPKVFRLTDKESMKAALENTAEADFTLVLPHWGNEYQLIHSKAQEEMAGWLAENGADMIIGAHPHVIQDCQTMVTSDGRQVEVAYSLGNAVSNMSAENTQLELMATIRIVRHCNGEIEMLPLEFTYLWCSRPGGYNNGYTVIPVKDFIGRRQEWQGVWDYDKMVTTYRRVQETTKIKDNNIL